MACDRGSLLLPLFVLFKPLSFCAPDVGCLRGCSTDYRHEEGCDWLYRILANKFDLVRFQFCASYNANYRLIYEQWWLDFQGRWIRLTPYHVYTVDYARYLLPALGLHLQTRGTKRTIRWRRWITCCYLNCWIRVSLKVICTAFTES